MSIDPLAEPAWDERIAGFPDVSVFHCQAWLSTLAATYGHRFQAIPIPAVGDSSGWLVLGRAGSALVGRTAVSVPFADYAPALLPPGEAAPVINQAAVELARSWGCRSIELRGGPPPRPDALAFRSYASHSIDLRSPVSLLWDKLSDSTRRSIKKARKSALEVHCLTSMTGLDLYYQLHCLTRRRLGLPPQPYAFFLHLFRCCLEPGKGFVVIAGRARAGHEGDWEGFQPMAGAVFLIHQRRAVYKYGASDDRFLSDRPNHLVMWTAIEKLSLSGAESLHLGRSDSDQEGLLRYKRSWGAVESRLDYYRYDLRRERFCLPRAASLPSLTGLFALLPPFLLRALGRLLYPHLH